MGPHAPLGEQELDILNYVSEHGPLTARQVVDVIGAEKQLARTTVLTVLERLRTKGYLVRKQADGRFVYTAPEAREAVLQNLVGRFVENMLGGAVSPVVAYLASVDKLTEKDLAEIERLVADLKTDAKADGPGIGEGESA